ncbi:MAG TPA: hypothetical protein VIQ30_22635 [Pseudonocardia sp.]
MARITTPVAKFTGHVAGVDFVDGVGETDDQSRLSYFARHGYTIEGAAEEPAGEVPLEKRKVDELRAYAEQNGIDLGEAKTKPEILAALAAAADGDNA